MRIIDHADPGHPPDTPLREFEGRPLGAGVSFIIVSTDQPGVGPDLHRHPYPETFVIRAGRARFTVGGEELTGVGGQIIVVPAGTAHAFAALGPGRLEMVDIHASDTFITEWLAGPPAALRPAVPGDATGSASGPRPP